MSEKEKELATADNIAAVQSKDVVGIIAQGKNSTSGYTVFFEQSPIDVFPITLFYFLPMALFKLLKLTASNS